MTPKLIAIVSFFFLTPAEPQFPPSLAYTPAGTEMLTGDQVRLLLTGTKVLNHPPGAPSQSELTFESGGKVSIRAVKGNVRSGTWQISGTGELCLENMGQGGGKDSCVYLRRAGNQIDRYSAKTGKKVKGRPWVIVKPGPTAAKVPDS